MSGMLMWSTRCRQLNRWAPPQILMPKCANHNRLATLHFEYVNCPIFLTTNIQRILKIIREWPNVKWMVDVSTKAIFTWTSKFISLLPKQAWMMFMQSLHWSGNCWLESTPSHELPTQEKHDHFPLWHYMPHYNQLQIVQLMCPWVDIHVGLMFIVILVTDEWIR